jgi:hypothetical protein
VNNVNCPYLRESNSHDFSVQSIIRENDKVKEDDALAHLSDQLLVLIERIYNIEKETIYPLYKK